MKVLEITGSAAQGGGPEHLFQLITHINLTFEVYLACPDTEPYYSKFKSILNDHVFLIPERKFSLSKAISLLRYAYTRKIEIVHTHGKAASLYGKFIKLFLPTILVHTPHGIHYKNYSFILVKLYFLFESLTKKLNDAIIFVSNSEQAMAKKIELWRNVAGVVIPNAVENIPVLTAFEIERVRKSYGIGVDDIVAVSVCRLDYAKNYLEICDIAKETPNLFFLVFGDGEGRLKMEKKISLENIQNVKLVGFVDGVKYKLPAFDIYLSTSRWEGMPLAVLEAMSCALPIIATDVPGNCDIVEHKCNGYLYQLGDIKQASHYLSRLSGDYELRKEMGAAGHKIQRKWYSRPRMINEISNLYKRFSH